MVSYHSWIDLFIKSCKSILNLGYYPQAGPYYFFYILIFSFCVIFAQYKMIKKFRHSSGFLRNQIKYVFAGSAIGFLGGATNFLPLAVFNSKITAPLSLPDPSLYPTISNSSVSTGFIFNKASE